MKILFLKIIKNYLFWAFLSLPVSIYVAYYFFRDKETVLAAISTGLVVMFGYFATHYLTVSRNLKEKKLQLCLLLIKKIRFFIIESDIKEKPQQSKMRDELQDAYFAFSLLTSEKSYKSLSEMMDKFKTLLSTESPDDLKLKEFKNAQSYFVNNLRKEFFTDREIKFETYDISLGQNNPKKI